MLIQTHLKIGNYIKEFIVVCLVKRDRSKDKKTPR